MLTLTVTPKALLLKIETQHTADGRDPGSQSKFVTRGSTPFGLKTWA